MNRTQAPRLRSPTGPAPSVRRSPWEQIDYSVPAPEDFILPEHHWPSLAQLPLSPSQRVKVNHVATAFSCEMFVQCERYVIHYLEAHRRRIGGAAPEAALDRFVAEERVHIDAFLRLLQCLAPHRYRGPELRFMRWTILDRLVLFLAPSVSLFLIAALFEEMSLFVSDVMDEQPEQSFAPVHEVMRLHAREERGHIQLDHRALEELSGRTPRWWFALHVWLSLPLMVYVDKVLGRAWRRAMGELAREEQLTPEQTKTLLARRPSKSDVLGIQSFIAKLQARPLPGSKLLCAALSRALT